MGYEDGDSSGGAISTITRLIDQRCWVEWEDDPWWLS